MELVNCIRGSFAWFKRRINQFLPIFDHPLPGAPCQITSTPPSSVVDSESALGFQQLEHESIATAPPAVEAAHNVHQNNLDWPLVLIGFCLASAVDIALVSIQIRTKLPLCLQFLSFLILLAFTSLFVAKFVTSNRQMLSQVLERAGIFFTATAFFIAMTIPFPLWLKLISWAIFVLALLAIIIYSRP